MSETTGIRERPILFSGPMVRAILEGRKTQTRRVVKTPGEKFPGGIKNFEIAAMHKDGSGLGWIAWSPGVVDAATTARLYPGNDGFRCPYGIPGDRLWVRETFQFECDSEYVYESFHTVPTEDPEDQMIWRPAIHMPRWASRIMLEITDVRVQRVQEISHEDIKAEGIELIGNYRAAFRELWDSINARRGYSWESNPWVWAITFRRLSETTGIEVREYPQVTETSGLN